LGNLDTRIPAPCLRARSTRNASSVVIADVDGEDRKTSSLAAAASAKPRALSRNSSALPLSQRIMGQTSSTLRPCVRRRPG
jgi:hypothetical protein